MASRFLFCLLLLPLIQGEEWAVLIAGSSGYPNYRHQADICHSYALLRSQGVSANNIIVFSYNDVASSSDNPLRGRLFNAPGSNATDVYAGCQVDYAGSDNNSTNFLAVLTGDEAAVLGVGSGRVLKSKLWDTVFISFVDHGAPGFLSFPNYNDVLYADTLVATLKKMKAKWMFHHLFFFVDACDSGSMFDGVLPNDISVYALTAASDSQFSWATYCPTDDVVDGTVMNTCLGDLFSVSWMDIVSRSDPAKLTLSNLYSEVSALTNLSTVSHFGDLSLASETVGSFLGSKKSSLVLNPSADIEVGWKSRDATFLYLSEQYLSDPSTSNAYLLMDELSVRAEVTAIFSELMNTLSPINPLHLYEATHKVRDFSCLRGAVNAYQKACGTLSEFGLNYVRVLKNACEEGISAKTIETTLHSVCGGDIESKRTKKRKVTPTDDWDDNDDHDDHDDYGDRSDTEDDFFGDQESNFSFWNWIIGL